MLGRIRGNSKRPATFTCIDLRGRFPDFEPIDARQSEVLGFDQNRFGKCAVTLIGAGGLNGEIAEGLVRKGVGFLNAFDGDTVEVTNLNRQFFFESDLRKNKAIRLAKNVSRLGFMGTVVTGYPFYLQEWLEKQTLPHTDLLVCGVDNDETRVFVSRHALKYGIPVVFMAVSRDANHGYVFVQDPGRACFGCLFPEAVAGGESPCPNTPAIKDILKVVAGVALYAVDTVSCDRRRNWNYRQIHLAGFASDMKATVEKRADCPLCAPRG